MTNWKLGQRVWYIGNDIGPAVISGVIEKCDTVRYRYLVNGDWICGYELRGIEGNYEHTNA